MTPDIAAKVIIDERTGMIVIGEAVTLRPAAVALGALSSEITETLDEAEPEYREALRIRREAYGDGHRTVASTRYHLGRLLRDTYGFEH